MQASGFDQDARSATINELLRQTLQFQMLQSQQLQRQIDNASKDRWWQPVLLVLGAVSFGVVLAVCFHAKHAVAC